ncbi:MAG: MinD/ParA family protein [Chloroflexi bacterium]|nr:MinD/ParA family protein [Chloroflexota bacterium]MCI0580741.1 MinD/ParA family protein [Chloroflexota bacterium]MCI0650012.1 MinD/ParA family protein [Chloroflexota bacterium]MCI0730476.1 MinD/ParA family protein [Chloroflexota bacterium]
MTRTISIHSFRRGTGKSSITANLTSILAVQGQRVGVIDTSVQTPGMHVLFGLDEAKIKYSLNDYLWGDCQIEDTIHDVTAHLHPGLDIAGQVFLIPASTKLKDITRALHQGYETSLVSEGLQKFSRLLNLDTLLIDTHAGLSDATLLSIAISDVTVVIVRLDEQNYYGTGIMVDVARELGVPAVYLVLNEVPAGFDYAAVRQEIERTYKCEVVAMLPYSDELMALASTSIFSLEYPDHPITAIFKRLAARIVV